MQTLEAKAVKKQGNGARPPAPPAPPTAKPVRRGRSWPTIVGILVLVGLGLAVVLRAGQKSPLPMGLIQVNGRIEGDLVTISSKYSGRIEEMAAREGDSVSRGQMLVALEDTELRARLGQAIASARAAEEQASGAASGVAVTAGMTNAQVMQAQGVVNQAESGVASARADLLRSGAAVVSSRASQRAAEATVGAAQASAESARAARARAIAALHVAEADLVTARASTRAAEAGAESASALLERAEKDAVRMRKLGKEGAVSDQTVDQANASERTARAQLDGAREQIAAAKAVEASREAAVSAAQEQVRSTEAGIREADAKVRAAREQAAAAASGVQQTAALERVAREAVGLARARRVQAIGQLNQANTAPDQVAVSRSAQLKARARIEQARQSVQELQATLAAMSVKAPVSGTVTTRFRDVGEVVTAGTPLLEVVDLDRLYLKVFVPEPEIGRIRLGLPARIYVDSAPDQLFEATVTYIASTAEFTPKEVQTPDERVKLVYAVKLSLKTNPQHRLTPGMPADAVIQWKPGVAWQTPRW